nr:MAG TPA: Thymidylate synthase complementing protein [Caudoviricetes sp.]
MDKIEVKIIDTPGNLDMMPFLARVTQRGHRIHNMADIEELLEKNASEKLRGNLAAMPHGSIKRFNNYTIAVVGASRRFLAQIRTHQHINFVSGSLQYSDWSDLKHPEEMFVVPYEIMEKPDLRQYYLDCCMRDFQQYKIIADAAGNDAAGYILPNGARNILILQANIQEWQYAIGLRTCRRNSPETRYIMYRIWEELFNSTYGPDYFSIKSTGCWCQTIGSCKEGHMSCGKKLPANLTPQYLLRLEFPLLYEEK